MHLGHSPLLSAFVLRALAMVTVLGGAFALPAAGAVRVEGDRLTVETPAIAAIFERGVPVRLVNRVTGQVLSERAGAAPAKSAGLVGLSGKAWWVEDAASVATRATAGGAEVVWTWADGAAMTLAVAPEAGDVVLRLAGRSPAPGLVGCRWALPGVNLRGRQVYLPEAYTGLLVDETTPPGPLETDVQRSWSHVCSLSFVQDARGTLGIWSQERSGCDVLFHGMVLPGGRADLSFEAHGEPPYAGRTEVATAPWRLAAAPGHWYGIAGRYRSEVLLPLRPAGLRRPEWARDIGCCIFYYTATADDLEFIARHVDPARTLLVFPFYRKHGFDQGYPDWSPAETFAALHRRARELGFRTCLWSNGSAVDPRLPTYEALKAFQRRDPYTGALLGWKWSDDPAKWERTTCAQIHRGASEYRRILREGMLEVTRQLQPSAWHIDYSIGLADGLGRVEGLNDFEGFYRLLSELRAALPEDLELIGEGLALGNAANMDVAEIFPYGVPERGLPVAAYLFASDVTTTAHVVVAHQRQGASDGAGSVAAWLAWLERFGMIPSGNVGAPGHGMTPSAEALYRIGKEFSRLRLRPDFSVPWSPATLFRWRSAEGVPYVCERTPTGARLAGSGGTVYERLAGVNAAAVGGRLRRWPAADGDRAFGLNPGVDYLVEAEPPAAKTRLAALPQGAYLSTFLETENAALVRLEPTSAYNAVVDLMADGVRLETGVLYEGKRRAPLEFGARFAPGTATCGGVARLGFDCGGPWKPGTPGWGQVFGEFCVTLPRTAEPLWFEAFVGLKDVAKESDGMGFLLQVDDREVARQRVTERRWHRVRADLSAYAGRQVTLRLVCDPGPAHNGSWDLGLWADAAVRRAPRAKTVSLRLPSAPAAGFDAAGAAVKASAPDLSVRTGVPGTIACFLRAPAPAAYPVDLVERPREAGMCDPGTYGCLVPVEYGKNVRIEGKPAVHAHPRGQGRGMLIYTLRVPASGRSVLRFTPRLAGPARTGQFSIEVNGELRWLKLVSQERPEAEQSVDLSAFAGKPVVLCLCYATHGGYPWGGQSHWVAPRIEGQ